MKRMMIACLLAVSLAGCETTGKAQVAALQTALSAAERSAISYAGLPLCKETVPMPCADLGVLKQIALADKTAYEAVTAARRSQDVGDYEKAKLAVDALRNIVNEIVGGMQK